MSRSISSLASPLPDLKQRTYVCYSGGKQVAYSTATKYPIIAGGIAIGRSADGKAINRMLQLSSAVS